MNTAEMERIIRAREAEQLQCEIEQEREYRKYAQQAHAAQSQLYGGGMASISEQGYLPIPRPSTIQQAQAMGLVGRDTSKQAAKHGVMINQVVLEPIVEPPTPMIPFEPVEMATGQAAELRRIHTPKMGEQFDMARMTVDCVLVVNKLVEVIESLQAQIADLLVLKDLPPIAVAGEPFKLQKLTDAYMGEERGEPAEG